MPASRSHRVFQCTLEVLGVPADAAQTWRHRTRALWDQEFAARLEAELDAAFPDPTDRIRIERLEIELCVRPDDALQDIGNAFRIAVRDRLTTARASHPPLPKAPTDDAPTKSTDPSGHEALEVWLLTGLLPWWADKLDLPTLRSRWLERLRTPTGPAWLRSIMAREPRAARRLALQFDTAWHHAALHAVWPEHWPDHPAFFEALERLVPGPPGNASTASSPSTEFWQTCWQRWNDGMRPDVRLDEVARDLATRPEASPTGTPRVEPLQALLRAWVALAPSEAPTLPHAVAGQATHPAAAPSDPVHPLQRSNTAPVPSTDVASRHDSGAFPPSPAARPTETLDAAPESSFASREAPSPSPSSPTSPDALRQGSPSSSPAELPHPSPQASAAFRSLPGESPDRKAPGSSPGRVASHRAAPSPAPSSHRTAEIGPVLASALAPGLPVSQAGLALVAVYLPRFFDQVGIRLSSDPPARRSADLAPLLLHYLATDQTQAPEHLLAFPKFLCGLPLDEPVVCEHTFLAEVREEVHQLLATVIRHWEALKNTSVRGLQQSFLQRPGLLRDTGPQWQLRVESRAWDMLIDRVPWGFRTLRLPWMPRPLSVEWNTYA